MGLQELDWLRENSATLSFQKNGKVRISVGAYSAVANEVSEAIVVIESQRKELQTKGWVAPETNKRAVG